MDETKKTQLNTADCSFDPKHLKANQNGEGLNDNVERSTGQSRDVVSEQDQEMSM